MRLLALLMVIAASAVPAGTASAHTVDAKKPVIFVASSQQGAVDCKAVFGAMTSKIASMKVKVGGEEQEFKQLVTVGATKQGDNCDHELGSASTKTETVARAFADWLAKTYSEPVDVVAEGTSGVAVRYALGKNGEGGWPKLDVEDVVTVGSPHGTLTEEAFGHPEGTQGTDWSVIGSDADGRVSADSAIAMDADHKTVYKDPGLTHQKLLDDVSSERDAQIVYQHGDGNEVTWNKAPHAVERIALDLVHGVDSCGKDAETADGAAGSCSSACKQEIAGWQLEFECPERDRLGEGVKGITVTSPDRLQLQIPQVPGIDYALPAASRRRLVEPVILPDLSVRAGGFSLTAFENTLGDDGLTIGIAELTLPRIGAAAVYGLQIKTNGTVAAESLELEVLGGEMEATTITFASGGGVRADTATLALPAALGGGAVEFSDVRIDGDGHLSGTLSGGRVKIGDLRAEVKNAKVNDRGFSVGEAQLILPKYLGDTTLVAKNLVWDGERVTFTEASGKVDFALAGGKLRVASAVELKLLATGGYEFSGSGRVVVGDEPRPFFEAAAALHVKSLDCDPAPGPCRNAAYLQKAALSIKTARPIPLGTTGLALRGLSGEVRSTQEDPRREADGTIRGVVYTFGLGADIVSFPNETVFDGKISGSLSTNGNFGLSLEGTTLRFIKLHGGMCVLFTRTDTVCADHVKRSGLAGPGAFVDVKASAGASYSGRLANVSAQLEASAFGRFVRSGGENYLDATLQGRFTASSSSWLLPDVEGSGTITAQLGRFNTPNGGSMLGVKGTIETKLKAQGVSEGRPLTMSRAIFIDKSGGYTEENVEAYTPAIPGRVSTATGRHEFELGERQTQTAIVLEAQEGTPSLELTTPGGQRAVVEAPASIRAVGGGRRDELMNVYAVRTSVPHTVIVHLPEAQPGRWVARVRGADPGHYRLDIQGNKPAPRLAITTRRPAKVTRHHRAATIRGTLRGGARRATVSLYAGRGGCGTRPGAKLLTARVRVRDGAWHYRWRPARATTGRFSIHAELGNGSRPLVVDCAKGAVVVKSRTHRHVVRPKRKRRTHGTRAVASSRPTPTRVRALAATHTPTGKSACKPIKDDDVPDRLPVFWVYETGPDKTPFIAANDANAIAEDKQPSTLNWAFYAKQTGCKSIAKKHRQQACGRRPFRVGAKPGPPDKKTKKRTSCDEYPFASTVQGGTGATIAGVEWAENTKQGHLYSAFLQRNAKELHRLNGEFHVCVVLAGNKKEGHCSSGPD